MSIDAAAVNRQVNLLDLVGRDTRLRKVANVSGRGPEFAGACPWCAGHDRFRLQPETGRWFCRRCSPDAKWGDAITYLMRRDHLDFREACERLAGGRLDDLPARPQVQPRAPAADPEPSPEWRANAERTVATAIECLWSDAGKAALAYLRKRGLQTETIRAAELGLLHPGSVDRGVVIPWRADGEIWAVKIRRAVERQRPGAKPQKYDSLPGSRFGLYGVDALGDQRAVVLVEAEFDALLIAQEASDLVAVAALGTAKGSLSDRVKWALLPFPVIFAALDSDPPGEHASRRLAGLARHIRAIRVPQGKDPTAFWQGGGSLRDWISFELARLDFERARLAGDQPAPETAVPPALASAQNRPKRSDPAPPAVDPAPAESLLDTAAALLSAVDGWAIDEARELFTGFSDAELRDAITTLQTDSAATADPTSSKEEPDARTHERSTP